MTSTKLIADRLPTFTDSYEGRKMRDLVRNLETLRAVQGPVGLTGDTGPAGDSVTLVAGEAVNEGQVVYQSTDNRVFVADQTVDANMYKIVGIATANVAVDESVVVQYGNIYQHPTIATFTAGQPVYLGLSGGLTQTKPTTGFVQLMGWATDNDRFFMFIDEPYLVPDHVSTSTNYTVTDNDYWIFVDASATSPTITLPTAVGRRDRIYNITATAVGAGQAITVDGNGSETINGDANVIISLANVSLDLKSDNSNWRIV